MACMQDRMIQRGGKLYKICKHFCFKVNKCHIISSIEALRFTLTILLLDDLRMSGNTEIICSITATVH